MFYATATPIDAEGATLLEGHEYEGSPGGYLASHHTLDAMECTIFMFGLLAELANAGAPFAGQLTIYAQATPDDDPDESESPGS